MTKILFVDNGISFDSVLIKEKKNHSGALR